MNESQLRAIADFMAAYDEAWVALNENYVSVQAHIAELIDEDGERTGLRITFADGEDSTVLST